MCFSLRQMHNNSWYQTQIGTNSGAPEAPHSDHDDTAEINSLGYFQQAGFNFQKDLELKMKLQSVHYLQHLSTGPCRLRHLKVPTNNYQQNKRSQIKIEVDSALLHLQQSFYFRVTTRLPTTHISNFSAGQHHGGTNSTCKAFHFS